MKTGSVRNALGNVTRRAFVSTGAIAILSTHLGLTAEGQTTSDPLPSWNAGPAKAALLAFVKDTTEKSSPKYVEPADRIATFDQDGTLWTKMTSSLIHAANKSSAADRDPQHQLLANQHWHHEEVSAGSTDRLTASA